MADARTAALVGLPSNVDIRRATPQRVSQDMGLLSMGLPSPLGDVTGLLADGFGYASGQQRLTPANGLLSLLGLVPGVPNAAMFLGPLAKTADLSALERAKAMLKLGASDDEVWKKTGWWVNTPDGVPRTEVPDGIDRFNAAYPDSGVSFVNNGHGNYNRATKTVEYSPEDLPHEAQHAVQHIEGMPGRAGSAPVPVSAVKGDQFAPDVQAKMAENRTLFGDPTLSERDWADLASNRPYWYAANEAEARAVDYRKAFSAKKRKNTPPWESYDVPLDRLIKQ